MQEILIINTGGTFNKRYNPLRGELLVPNDTLALEGILRYFYNLDYKVVNTIHKDSLDMDDDDRQKIVTLIKNSPQNKVIIIHGTDTMDKTAKFLDMNLKNRCVVLTGAMVPFSIDTVEATTNLSTAIGYILNCQKNGIYIAMHGLVDIYNVVYKNRKIGIFQRR